MRPGHFQKFHHSAKLRESQAGGHATAPPNCGQLGAGPGSSRLDAVDCDWQSKERLGGQRQNSEHVSGGPQSRPGDRCEHCQAGRSLGLDKPTAGAHLSNPGVRGRWHCRVDFEYDWKVETESAARRGDPAYWNRYGSLLREKLRSFIVFRKIIFFKIFFSISSFKTMLWSGWLIDWLIDCSSIN